MTKTEQTPTEQLREKIEQILIDWHADYADATPILQACKDLDMEFVDRDAKLPASKIETMRIDILKLRDTEVLKDNWHKTLPIQEG